MLWSTLWEQTLQAGRAVAELVEEVADQAPRLLPQRHHVPPDGGVADPVGDRRPVHQHRLARQENQPEVPSRLPQLVRPLRGSDLRLQAAGDGHRGSPVGAVRRGEQSARTEADGAVAQLNARREARVEDHQAVAGHRIPGRRSGHRFSRNGNPRAGEPPALLARVSRHRPAPAESLTASAIRLHVRRRGHQHHAHGVATAEGRAGQVALLQPAADGAEGISDLGAVPSVLLLSVLRVRLLLDERQARQSDGVQYRAGEIRADDQKNHGQRKLFVQDELERRECLIYISL